MPRASVKNTTFRRPAKRGRVPITRDMVKAAVRGTLETKHRVYQYNADAIDSTTGIFTDTTSFAAGPDYDARDGNKIYVKSLHLHGIFKCAATDKNNIMRLMIGVAKGTPLTSAPNSLYATPQYKSAWVKYDKTYSSYVTDDATGVVGVPINLKIKINSEVTFADETATAAIRNQVFLGMLSDSGAVTHPTFTGHCVIWYKDI